MGTLLSSAYTSKPFHVTQQVQVYGLQAPGLPQAARGTRELAITVQCEEHCERGGTKCSWHTLEKTLEKPGRLLGKGSEWKFLMVLMPKCTGYWHCGMGGAFCVACPSHC